MNAHEEATQGDDHQPIPVFLTSEISVQRSNSIASSWRQAEAAAKGRVHSIHFHILSVGSSRGSRQLDPGIACDEWRSRSHAAALPLSGLCRLSGQRQHRRRGEFQM